MKTKEQLMKLTKEELVNHITDLENQVRSNMSTPDILRMIMSEEELTVKEIQERLKEDYGRELSNTSQIYTLARNHGLSYKRTKNNDESKQDKIVELAKQGKTRTEIAAELETNYSYVVQVLGRHKEELQEYFADDQETNTAPVENSEEVEQEA